jgi:signal transduction histidine kinase
VDATEALVEGLGNEQWLVHAGSIGPSEGALQTGHPGTAFRVFREGSRPEPGATVGRMDPVARIDPALRARIALGFAAVALVAGIVTLVAGRVDLGVTLASDGTKIRILAVADRSPAAQQGLQPGMTVISLNDVQILRLPEPIYPSPDPDGNVGDPIGIDPVTPTPIDLGPGEIDRLSLLPVNSIVAVPTSQLQYTLTAYPTTYVQGGYLGYQLEQSVLGLLAGGALLLGGSWWLLSGRGGSLVQTMAIPVAVAVAVPLIVQPLWATWSAPAIAFAGVLVPLALAPLALALLDLVPEGPSRLAVRAGVYAAIGAAVVIGLVRVWVPIERSAADVLWGVLTSGIPLTPGIAAAVPAMSAESRGGAGGRVGQSTELAVAGVTPAFAMMVAPSSWPFMFPLSVWLLGVLAAARFSIRPLRRVAVRAQLQRDLIVAATEAERARVAADIHDDALQELTLLVQRLDEAGDADGADIARTVSDRLRAICGDLRLPILDDLGVGPALDWLASRIERLAGGEVRLERSDGSRLPPDVELGIFRVAQEALANAVKHGKPPITVRYHATPSGASLSIDDAGPGIEPNAAKRAELDGRFGLLNMQQRAEQIGAILDVRRWPAGGTHVALEWRAP